MLFRSVKELEKDKLQDQKRAQYADKASEFWLQYRYGFLPLYLTVQDVIKQFNRDVKVWTRNAKRSSNTEDIELGMFTEYLPDDTGY